MNETIKWQGYISSRLIDGQAIPQRIQNFIIRQYVQKHKKTFLLSATEYYMENCFMMLKSLMDEMAPYQALVFYSLYLLPPQKKARLKIYQQLLQTDRQLHFALEELSITNFDDINLIEDIIMTKELAEKVQWESQNFSAIKDGNTNALFFLR